MSYSRIPYIYSDVKGIKVVGIDSIIDSTRKSIYLNNIKFNTMINTFGGIK